MHSLTSAWCVQQTRPHFSCCAHLTSPPCLPDPPILGFVCMSVCMSVCVGGGAGDGRKTISRASEYVAPLYTSELRAQRNAGDERLGGRRGLHVGDANGHCLPDPAGCVVWPRSLALRRHSSTPSTMSESAIADTATWLCRARGRRVQRDMVRRAIAAGHVLGRRNRTHVAP